MSETGGHGAGPGQLLREARAAKGLTLAQVAAATRIAENFLAAIENGEHDILPPLYVRSFLRSYATAVGLPFEEVLASWDRLTGRAGAMEAAAPAAAGPEIEISPAVPPRRRLPLRWIGLALVAVVVVVAAVRLLDRSGRAGGTAAPASRPPVVRAADGPRDDPRDDPAAAGGPGESPAPGAGAMLAADTLLAAAPAAAAPPDTLAPPAPAGVPHLALAGGRAGPLVLRIVVARPVGLAVAADGRAAPRPVAWPDAPPAPAPGQALAAGAPYRVREGIALYWSAEDHFVLRLSAAAGVEVRLNDQVIPVPGEAVGRDWLLDAAALARP